MPLSRWSNVDPDATAPHGSPGSKSARSKEPGVAEHGQQATYDRAQTDQNDEKLEKLGERGVAAEICSITQNKIAPSTIVMRIPMTSEIVTASRRWIDDRRNYFARERVVRGEPRTRPPRRRAAAQSVSSSAEPRERPGAPLPRECIPRLPLVPRRSRVQPAPHAETVSGPSRRAVD